jgi:dTMP kinase
MRYCFKMAAASVEGFTVNPEAPMGTGLTRGRFVVLEGIDGCGKTTQLQALRQWLPSSGLMAPGARLVVSREPGGTALGQALRELLLHPPQGVQPLPRAELLLYAADRAQHVEALLLPALQAGDWVLCDRFTGSTAAYQGYGRGLPLALIDTLENLATGGLQADLTLWLDVSLAESRRRRGGRPADRIEAAGEVFQTRVAAGFATLAAQRGWIRIEAGQPVAAVTDFCRAAIRRCVTSN